MGFYKNTAVDGTAGINSYTQDPCPQTEYGVASLSLTGGTQANTEADAENAVGTVLRIIRSGNGYSDKTGQTATAEKNAFTGITSNATGMKVDYDTEGGHVVSCKIETTNTGGKLQSGDRFKLGGRTTNTGDYDCIVEAVILD